MIISHKYQFIFIKTGKTAGTSIEVDLSKSLDRNDVATPIFPEVEGHIVRNFEYRKFLFSKRKLYNHMPAKAVKAYLGYRLFDKYFKFCVEREPVDKCISHYSMLRNSPHHNKKTSDLSFEQYVSNGNFPVDTSKYTDSEGRLIVDRILRYEDLANELSNVCEELGFWCGLKAQAKVGFREDIKVTEEQRQIIYEAFKESNKFTGYRLRMK
jgi:hypothetical protein